MKTTQRGYIMIYTLLMVGLALGVVAFVMNRVVIFDGLTRLMLQRAQARQLALGGITLAMSELTISEQMEKKSSSAKGLPGQEKEAPPEDPDKKLLVKILPLLNKWQTIPLQQERDGIKGTIHLYIASENGKFNLNDLYDFEKKRFAGEPEKKSAPTGPEQPKTQSATVEKALAVKEQSSDGRKLLQAVLNALTAQMGTSLSISDLEGFYTKRKKPLDDVTQIMEIPGFAAFKKAIFVQPPSPDKKDQIYLTDLFTVSRPSAQIDPWLFSDSVRGVLGLSRVKQSNKKGFTPEQLKQVKLDVNWATEWNTLLQPVYEKDYASLPKTLTPFFRSKCEMTTFSVIAYGTVGKVTVRYYAIIERIKKEQNKVVLMIKQLYQV